MLDRLLAGYGAALPRDVGRIVMELRTGLARVAEGLAAGPKALIHGDLHLDNLLFDERRADRPVVVLDWQTVATGSPAWDLALFVFGSLSVGDRRAAEAEFLGRYVELLSLNGVRDYSVDDVRRDCRLALLVWLAGTVLTRDANVLSEREQALRAAAFGDGRLVAALLDYDVGGALAVAGRVP